MLVRRSGDLMIREVPPSGAGADGDTPPTVLWVHGLGESGLGFEKLLRHAALSPFRHLVPDLLGYGRSPWIGEPRTLAQHADDLVAFAGREISGSWVVVGHSMGGVIGQLLAEKEPDGLVGFVNVEGNISLGDCGYSSQAVPFSLDDFVAHGFDLVRQRIFDAGVNDAAHRTYFASCCLCRAEAFHLNGTELVELSEGEGLARRFAELDLPRSFAQGKPDGAPERSTELLCSAGVEPVLFEPAGHWPFIDRRDQVGAWLARELQRFPLS